MVGVLVGGVVVVVGALPQTGSPGTGAWSGPPVKNTVGAHTPTSPSPTHAHQLLVRVPTEYFDPFDWHRNGDWPGRKLPRRSVVPGRYAGAGSVTVQA